MPHKIADRKTVKKLEDAIAYYDRSIDKIRSFRKGDGWKGAVAVLKDVRNELGTAVANCLGNPNTVRVMRAIGWQGEVRGLQKAIDIFENPEGQLDFYKSQRKIAADALKKLGELEKSDE